jgi:hypothetical protein
MLAPHPGMETTFTKDQVKKTGLQIHNSEPRNSSDYLYLRFWLLDCPHILYALLLAHNLNPPTAPCKIYQLTRDLHQFQIICLEDGTDEMFRNVGQYKPHAGETPKRKHTESIYLNMFITTHKHKSMQ